MSFEIQTTSYFDSEAKRLAKRHRSFVDDLSDFRDSILKNPFQGTELSPGIRKVRMTIASKGRGQSGGARVITFTYILKCNVMELQTVNIDNQELVPSGASREGISVRRPGIAKVLWKKLNTEVPASKVIAGGVDIYKG